MNTRTSFDSVDVTQIWTLVYTKKSGNVNKASTWDSIQAGSRVHIPIDQLVPINALADGGDLRRVPKPANRIFCACTQKAIKRRIQKASRPVLFATWGVMAGLHASRSDRAFPDLHCSGRGG